MNIIFVYYMISASKVAETGIIQLWRLTETLDGPGSSLRPYVIANLSWVETDSKYIGIDANQSMFLYMI